jgi:AraC family L-rhamnose operon transcriptional activator RhaR
MSIDANVQDLGLLRLSAQELLPRIGAPIHVNSPTHHGDIPLHDHDFFELTVVAEGHGLHRTIHGRSPLRAGDAFFIQPGQWHAYESCRKMRIWNCCFAETLMQRELSWVRSDPQLSRIFQPPAQRSSPSEQGIECLRLDLADLSFILDEFQALRSLMSDKNSVRVHGDVIGHLLLVFGVIARRKHQVGRVDSMEENGPIRSVIQAMEADISKDWSLDHLASRGKLNRSYLVRLFKRKTGESPMAYLARRRAEMAAIMLLTTDMSIAGVGKAVGWPDQNYFARRFRGIFGMTASTYRQQLPVPAFKPQAADWIQW